MYLVDPSVWINYLRGQHTKASEHFMQLLDEKHSFGISPIIYQEILQGAATQKDFNKLNEYLSTHRFFYPAEPLQFHYHAAHILFACRAKGFTIRSTIDCLIAQTAIEHEWCCCMIIKISSISINYSRSCRFTRENQRKISLFSHAKVYLGRNIMGC